jgi:hypothetical protein
MNRAVRLDLGVTGNTVHVISQGSVLDNSGQPNDIRIMWPSLNVSGGPLTALAIAGVLPQPPIERTLTLTNTADGNIRWTAEVDVDWLTLGYTDGVLLEVEEMDLLPVSVNDLMALLPAGVHVGTITVTNATNGVGSAQIPFTLTLLDL